jgi:hypothetical protein
MPSLASVDRRAGVLRYPRVVAAAGKRLHEQLPIERSDVEARLAKRRQLSIPRYVQRLLAHELDGGPLQDVPSAMDGGGPG